MRENKGFMPEDCAGKRVRGYLRCGIRFGYGDPAWMADGRGACRWSLLGDAFDIVKFEIAG